MDNLRWVLLAIGALIVIAIYLWDFLGKKITTHPPLRCRF